MTALSTMLRLTSALVLAGGAAGAVYAVQELVPALEPAPVDVTRSVQVPAGVTIALCHSAPDLPEGSVAYDRDFNPVPVEPTAELALGSFPRGGAAGEGSFVTGDGTEPLVGGAARWVTAQGLDGPGWAVVDPVAGQAALVAGTGAWRVDAGDLRSLVAAPCLAPASDLWLVGGATTLGRSAVLELVNPGETTATIKVEGWGPTGPLDLPLLESLSLAPGTGTRVLIEASVADVERLALHVAATGGRVSAALIDSALAGVTPQGVELVVPTLAPSTELVMAVDLGTDPQDPASPANLLRLLNPGSEPAVATVELLGPDGGMEVPGAAAITVDAGAVFDITLAGLPAGAHAVRVTADRPLAGAVQSARAATAPTTDAPAIERAWSVATVPATGAAVVLPRSASATLVLSNPGTADAVVALVPYGADGAAGSPLEVRVPAGASVAADPGDALALVREADEPVSAAALLRVDSPDGPLISVLPFTVDANVRQTVEVVVGNRGATGPGAQSSSG